MLILFIAWLFAACKEPHPVKHKQSATPVENIPVNDTFAMEYNDHLRIPQGIYLDTVHTRYRQPAGEETLILPRLKEKAFTAIDKALIQEVQRRLRPTNGSNTIARANRAKHWNIITSPVHIYQSASFISYAFISVYSDPELMRPYRTYMSVNYDVQRHKLLHVNDYFSIRTTADSALFSYIIRSAMGERNNPYWLYNHYDSLADFAVSADKLYFYFDQFSAGGNPCGMEGSVQKKYYLNLIKHEYQ